MADTFSTFTTGLNSPAENAAVVSKSDDTPLAVTSRALWIGETGDLTVIMNGGQTVTFLDVPVGWYPIRVTHVKTATTASSIIAVW